MHDYFKAVERLEAARLKPQEPAPDRFAFLKAARDACLIEIVVGVVFFACAFAALSHQGIIVWP
jgi:hypothetical protein